MSTEVDHLSLHQMVLSLEAGRPELAKFQRLRAHFGELKPADEHKYRKLLRRAERELLHSADVICTTCAGAGDRRLLKFRFRKVRKPTL